MGGTIDILATLELVGLNSKKIGKNFSFGMEQRYAIASALIGSPDIVLLDEPTNGIDAIDIEHIKSLIKEASAGKNIVFSSHQLDEILSLSDSILGLSHGNMLFFEDLHTINEEARKQNMDMKQFLLERIKN